MAVDNYPIFDLSAAMHKALYASAEANFNGAVLNCMDMTADAYLNFGSSAVARAVEDYFPYEKGENYNLQKGNAAAHIVQAIYNSIYFSQMVYPDFDMFQSHNPNAVSHAIARTINNGPIYLTDNPGEQNFDLLNHIVYSDGRIIKSDTPLLPAEDCLFQVQKPELFKAFSKAGGKGLLGLWNAADANTVSGKFKASDVYGIKGERFALYEYFSENLRLAKRSESFNISLPRMGYQLQYVVPVKNNFAAFGLINKYNAPATILSEKWEGAKNIEIQLYEGGRFKAYAGNSPVRVLVNGKVQKFTFEKKLLVCNIDVSLEKPVLAIEW
jgi:raffinose synthase